MCLYIITTGTLPFDEPNLPVMFDKISRADYPPAPWWSPELAHLIHHILMPDPLQRRVPPGTPHHVAGQHSWRSFAGLHVTPGKRLLCCESATTGRQEHKSLSGVYIF